MFMFNLNLLERVSGAARTDLVDKRDAFSAASSYSMFTGTTLIVPRWSERSVSVWSHGLAHSESKSLGLLEHRSVAQACCKCVHVTVIKYL